MVTNKKDTKATRPKSALAEKAKPVAKSVPVAAAKEPIKAEPESETNPATKTAATKETAKTAEKITLVKVEFNDLTYELSTRDRDLLMGYNEKIQKILSNAKIVEDMATLKRVMGKHYAQCVIYNCEECKLLTEEYHGIPVAWTGYEPGWCERFKCWFDKELKVYNQTLVYFVLKQILKRDWPGVFEWTKSGESVPMNPNGGNTVCNFVVRNEKTGKLQMFSDSWYGMWGNWDAKDAAHWGMNQAAHDAAWDPEFRWNIWRCR